MYLLVYIYDIIFYKLFLNITPWILNILWIMKAYSYYQRSIPKQLILIRVPNKTKFKQFHLNAYNQKRIYTIVIPKATFYVLWLQAKYFQVKIFNTWISSNHIFRLATRIFVVIKKNMFLRYPITIICRSNQKVNKKSCEQIYS